MEVEAYRAEYPRELLVGEGPMAGAFTPIATMTDDPDEPYERPAQELLPAVASVELSPASPHITSPSAEALRTAPAARG